MLTSALAIGVVAEWAGRRLTLADGALVEAAA
mgnify:CR=1 FL=1